MIAAVTLKFLDPFGTGKIVLFQVTYDKVGEVGYLRYFTYLILRTGLARC
jgi:chloride channel 3/4/5